MSRETDAVDALKTSVGELTTVAQSVSELLDRLFAALRDSSDVTPEIEAIIAAFEADKANIIASVERNTPAAA